MRPRLMTKQLIEDLNQIHERTLDAGIDVSLSQSQHVRKLVRLGADSSSSSSGGLTPLAVASYAGDLGFIEELLASGIPTDAVGNQLAALGAAAYSGKTETVDFLLQHGASVSTSTSGVTPLMIAGVRGNPHVIRALVRAGAEVDERDARGQTALFRSVSYGRPEGVRTLLSLGADPACVDKERRTALQYAIQTRDRLQRQQSKVNLARWNESIALLRQAARATGASKATKQGRLEQLEDRTSSAGPSRPTD
jgi:ankyrin repeat protein